MSEVFFKCEFTKLQKGYKMAVPKRKTSKSKRDMRRSHGGITPVSVAVCKNCGEIVMQHTICKACGHYNGKEIVSKKIKAKAA